MSFSPRQQKYYRPLLKKASRILAQHQANMVALLNDLKAAMKKDGYSGFVVSKGKRFNGRGANAQGHFLTRSAAEGQ